MRGERIVAWVRLVFCALSAASLSALWTTNTATANSWFAVQVGVWLVFAVGTLLILRGLGDRYAGWLKYVTITFDLAILAVAAPAMAHNHSGIVEWYMSVMPLVYVVWGLLAGMRFHVGAGVYATAVAVLIHGGVLAWTVSAELVPLSPNSTYGRNEINVGDQVFQIGMIAVAILVATLMAWSYRRMLTKAASDAHQSEVLRQREATLSKYLPKELVKGA